MIDDDDDDDGGSTAVRSVEVLTTYRVRPCVIILNGPDAGKMFPLSGSQVVGRTDADITLTGPGVSRRHARLTVREDNSVEVADLGSTNGTFVDGLRIDAKVLHDGDKLQIGGTTVLKFSYQDALEQNFQNNLYESATRDALTQVLNRRSFDEVLEREVAHALRRKHQISVLMLDIDKFKRVNDTWGHLCGDYVLQRFSTRVREMLRTEDLLARYGGEEFTVVLRETGGADALRCAERIRQGIQSTTFTFEGQVIPVTVSIGIAVLLATHSSNAKDLVKVADDALYKAKESGRNRVEIGEDDTSGGRS